MPGKDIITHVHHNALTEQRSHFINEYGRLASHILFCEFIDNACKALLQSAVLQLPQQVNLPAIEVHLIFSKEHPYLLKHIAVFDAGPGMAEETMVGWSNFAAPASQRESANKGAAELRKENEVRKPPFQAGGELGFFGKGSKTAGFFYGECVTAVTKTAGRTEKTRELRMDVKVMQAAGHDWQHNQIQARKQGRDAILSLSHWRDLHDEKDKSLLALLERADRHPTYSLFIISRIHKEVAEEVPHHAVQSVASELRDVYYVYCDGLEGALQRMRERAAEGTAGAPGRRVVFPTAQFKYSPLDVHLIAHAEHGDRPVQHISLRDDPTGANAVSVARLVEDARETERALRVGLGLSPEHTQLLDAQRWSPSELLSLAAPDPFFFKFEHRRWNTVWGMALYLPFADGRETREELKLHDNSRAVCFWAGRLMPYCKVPGLLPWMDWAKKDKSWADVTARVVMLLFFGQVANVDATKFRLADDILNDLAKPGAGPTDWEAWRESQPGRAGWERASGRLMEDEFKKWNQEANTKYDEHCELSDRLEETTMREGKQYAMFRRLQYGSRSALTSYSTDDVAKVKMTVMPSYSGSSQPRVVLGRVRYFLVELSTVAAGTGSHTCARCDAVVTREPESLYSSEQEHVIKAQALVSKEASAVSILEKEEKRKAPSRLHANFVLDPPDGGAGASAPTISERLGRSPGAPLLVEANQPVHVVRVRPLNAAKALVYDWRHSKSLKALQVEQSISYAEATGASAGSSALGAMIGAADFGEPPPAVDGSAYNKVVNDTVWKPEGGDDSTKGYHFNNGENCRLSFWKAGMYRLTYRLKTPAGDDLTAELFVMVTPALVVRLSCELAAPHDTRPVRLGEALQTPVKKMQQKGGWYGLEVRVRLRDGDGDFANTRVVSDKQLSAMVATPDGGNGHGIVVYPSELLSDAGLTTGVGRLQSWDGKKAPKGEHGGCRLFVGLMEDNVYLPRPAYLGEGQLTAGLWPSEAAVRQRLFSRHTPRTLQMAVALNHCPGVTCSEPRGTVDVPVVSAAPLRLRLAPTADPPTASLPSATDGPAWMHTSAALALAAAAAPRNCAPLPAKVAVALRDDFECALPLGVVIRLSAACVAPGAPNAPASAAAACPGMDGSSAVVNASGVAVFKRMTPRLTRFSTVAEARAPGGGVVRGALVRLRFTAAIGIDDSEAVPATPEDAEALASEAEELAQLQVDRFVFLTASRVPAALQLSRGGQPLRADRAGALVLTGSAGGSLADVDVTIHNEVGDTLTWAEAEQAGTLTMDGKKVDGSKPLTGLKLPSSIDDVARYRLAFAPKQEARGAGGAPTLEAHFVLKPEPGQPARWLIRRSGVAAGVTGRRAAAGPLELRVGQALGDTFTIVLVDEKGNGCRRATLAPGVAPILTVRSGNDTGGPWLIPGGPAAAGVNGAGQPARCRELLLDHEAPQAEAGGDAVWQVATHAYAHVGVSGPASTNDRPEEMLCVSDAQGAYAQEMLPFKLLAGPPHALELEPKSKSTLSARDLRTRERLPPLVFVVVDAASNAVPVDQLTVKPLTAAAHSLLKVTHARAMEPEGNGGARWSLRDVRLTADRAGHVAPASGTAEAGRLRHELSFGAAPVAKAADGVSYHLQCAPMQLATRIRDEFVIGVVCGSGNPAEVAAGTELDSFKIALRVEDNTICNFSEIQLRNESSLRNQQAVERDVAAADVSMPNIDCIKCVLNSPDGKVTLHRAEGTALFRFPNAAPDTSLDASGNASGRLTRAGAYSVTATYKEHRPKVLDVLQGTQEAVVTQTVFELKVRAGPPARLRWARAPRDPTCNNTTGRQLFGRLEARLEDVYGNPAVADGALVGATLTALLAPTPEPSTSTAAAAPPRLEGSVSGTIDGKSSKITIGPVAVERGTGRGDSQLCVTFQLRTAGGEVALPAVEVLPDLAVRFEDTFSLAEEEARAKEAEAEKERLLREEHAAILAVWQAKEAEWEQCKAEILGHVEEMRTLSADLVKQAGQVDVLNVQLSTWVVSWSVLLNLGKEQRAQLQQRFQTPPQHWDATILADLIAPVLEVDRQQAGHLCSTLWRELAHLMHRLADFSKLTWTDDAFRNARQYLLALPSPGGSLRTITEIADGLGTWVEQLSARYPENRVDGLTDRERELVNQFRSVSEQNRRECFGPIADLLVVPFAGPATQRIAAVLSALASPRNLQRILLQSMDAAQRLQKYARERNVRLSYQVLEWTNAGHVPQPQQVVDVSFAWAAGDMVQPNPDLSREDQAKVRTLLPWLFRNIVIVRDENEAVIYRRGIRGKAPRIVGLDGFSMADGGFSDRPDGRLPTELGRAPHFAIQTRRCPLSDLAYQVRHFANALEVRSKDVQEKLPQWERSTQAGQRLGDELSQLSQKMNEVLQPLSARGATTNQTKRPRVEDASAGPRPVCPRVDTPSSSQGAGTQFVIGRQAEPQFHHDVRHGNGQRRNGQQHHGGSQYADI